MGLGSIALLTVTLLFPLEGEDVLVEDPTFTVSNDTAGAVSFDLELYSDPALTGLVHVATAAASTSGATTFTLDDTLTDAGDDGDDPGNPENVDLADDTSYWWRARSFDGVDPGPWSPARRVHYDPTNDAPSAPQPDDPLMGETVGTLSAVLRAGNPIGDDDPLLDGRMFFFVYLDDPSEGAPAIRQSNQVLPGEFGTSAWIVTPALPQDDRKYYWNARWMDARGALSYGPQSFFFVNTGNDEPGPPTLIAPLDGASVESVSPALEAGPALDGDGDLLTYVFDVDVTPAFNSSEKQSGVGDVFCGLDGQNRCFTPPEPLVENVVYWWRARAFDGAAYSQAVIGSFRVDEANDAPSVPVPLSPFEALVLTETPTLFALGALDPEGEPMLYDFQVLDEEGKIVAETFGVAPETDGHVSWTVTNALEKGEPYTWRVRAVDERALAGELSAGAPFEVHAPSDGGGGGGGCTILSRRSSPAPHAALAAATLLGGLLRRSRARREA